MVTHSKRSSSTLLWLVARSRIQVLFGLINAQLRMQSIGTDMATFLTLNNDGNLRVMRSFAGVRFDTDAQLLTVQVNP